ncbi:IS5 family transposase [Paracoccus sp. IB05]|uniref:IS5 family transposase n=1 Tax=Paracoccus sp. IB05 TaxID=2779367 RepID=UPI0018E8FD7C|nr:IS5 family transposase [Paracoccus sp. IB05]MBJ2154122.1 IS5 family transposase [Paracoccus sp. IB05]
MSKPVPLFRTTNWSSYSRSLKRRGSLMVWFDPEMAWFAVPSGKAGHPERFSAVTIQFCLSIKVLFGLPLRQTTGFVESLLALSGLDWPVPDYTTLCRRQKHLKVQIPYRAASGPLHLLVDSTGIKFSGEGEWQVRKHGASRRRQWRKIHIGIDAETLEVRAVEMTSNCIGDAPVLPGLLAQIPVHERIGSVTADGIYDTKGCHTAIAARGGDAIIPPRRNARDWKGHDPGLQARNEALRACKRFGRANWKKWSGYHRRSRVEAKMRCLKLLGERIMARDFDRQDAEVQIRIALMNRFTSLGTPETVRMR